MPWKETGPVEQRMEFVMCAAAGHQPFAEICRRYGVSRKTGYKWMDRYHSRGIEGLGNESRAPRRHPQAVGSDMTERLIEMRRVHPDWGPITILHALRRKGVESLPAPSTVGELLKRHGLVVTRSRRVRPPPGPRPEVDFTAPNRCWCIDFKGQFQLGNRKWCYPLTVTDGHSRFLLCCDGLESTELAGTKKQLERCFAEYGVPDAILSDNGTPFSSGAAGGLSRLSVWWIKLGIRPVRITRGKPQQNGRHERMHRTLKRRVGDAPAQSMPKQQEVFDAFRTEYNTERPHQALGGRTPADLYETSDRPLPAKPEPPSYPGSNEVRAVRQDGSIKWRGHTLFLSEALSGESIGLQEFDDDRWLIRFGPIEVAVLDDRATPSPVITRLPYPPSRGAQDCPG